MCECHAKPTLNPTLINRALSLVCFSGSLKIVSYLRTENRNRTVDVFDRLHVRACGATSGINVSLSVRLEIHFSFERKSRRVIRCVFFAELL